MGLSAWNSRMAQQVTGRVSAPDNTLGYYRGDAEGHRFGNQGSGQGSDNAGRDATMGSTGLKGKAGQWHPTVVWMLGLVLAEVAALGIMRKLTKHGG